MSETLVDKLTEALGRRRFLGKVASATAAVVLAVVGINTASASDGQVQIECCFLCKNPATCSYTGCVCQWSWPCSSGGTSCFHCKECYTQTGNWCIPSPGVNNCNEHVKCSKAQPRACE